MLILYLDDPAAAAAEVEGLSEALKKAESETAVKKTAAEKAVVELEKAKLAAEQHEARVTEVQVELQDAAEKLEALEKGEEEQSSRLSKAEKELQEARTDARGVREELRQAAQIANGKKYLVQSVFGGNRFPLLTRVWRSAGVFTELPKNVTDAVRHYATLEEDSTQRLFWSQFSNFERPPLLSDQMQQLMEMH
jgi:chromosome segregation ATPase